ncbi:MAG: hypothetical protein M1823_008845, partial [Watsoniomyces obsoletus]
MRKRVLAPVDTMGCESLADKIRSPCTRPASAQRRHVGCIRIRATLKKDGATMQGLMKLSRAIDWLNAQ